MNKKIETYVLKATAWCANDIMYLYSKNTPGVHFEREKCNTNLGAEKCIYNLKVHKKEPEL